MADVYKTNRKSTRTGAEIIGTGRNPKPSPAAEKPKDVKTESAPAPRSGVHLKRGVFNG